MPSTRLRLIVAITGSLTNLHALRQAVAMARARDAALYADRLHRVAAFTGWPGGEGPR
jgi:hypothetical protein